VITYLDTGAFVKLVIDEERADEPRSWFEQSGPAITSAITPPESCAALGQRAAVARRCRTARGVAGGALRGMDAIQLAAAIRVRERLDEQRAAEPLAFASYDRRLLEAAEREGFATLGGPLG
jgi:predicted nucleic acid-binding protein